MVSSCCIKGFEWLDETPVGKESIIGDHKTYVTGSNPEVAILVIHDLFGWTFNNIRLLADHYAKEADATVYVPDFFGGEVVPSEILRDTSRWGEFDLKAWTERNYRTVREPELISVTTSLRSKYKKLGALGYCFGGWAVFVLGSKNNKLVDCISTAHPTWLTKEDIDNVAVPVQVCAPEVDRTYTPELKEYTVSRVQELGVPFDYQFFPGLEHSFATRANPEDEKELKGVVRCKRAMVAWMREWLHDQ